MKQKGFSQTNESEVLWLLSNKVSKVNPFDGGTTGCAHPVCNLERVILALCETGSGDKTIKVLFRKLSGKLEFENVSFGSTQKLHKLSLSLCSRAELKGCVRIMCLTGGWNTQAGAIFHRLIKTITGSHLNQRQLIEYHRRHAAEITSSANELCERQIKQLSAISCYLRLLPWRNALTNIGRRGEKRCSCC